MQLIGLLLNLLALTVTSFVDFADAESLTLRPADETMVRYTNESLIVLCSSESTATQVHWLSPNGEIIKDHKGRIHIEQNSPGHVKIVFTHITLADKGTWSCEHDEGGQSTKSFNLIVYQKITFTENTTILTVKEGKNATILCEVKGEPQPNVTWNFNGQPINIDVENLRIRKFRILADGLLVNTVTQNDTGEYTCRAYQVNSIASDMQERTVLMKIEHKPFWTHKAHVSMQYAYINGSVDITCEAIAEPPANFTWHRGRKRLHNDKHYNLTSTAYVSTLTIHVLDTSVFDTYKCRAQNAIGAIERTTTLEQGVKPPPPSVLQLRGFNSNTFDVDVGSVRMSPIPPKLMDVNGFLIEYMTEYEFKSDLGKWTKAKRKEFPFEDGATFLINNLEPNTTYLMRAASKNLAGLSDWTKVEKFSTLSNEPPSSSGRYEHLTITQLLCVSMVALCLVKELAFGFQDVSGIVKLDKGFINK